MKTDNLNPDGNRAGDVARGRKANPRAGGTLRVVAGGLDLNISTLYIDGGALGELDDDEAILTIASSTTTLTPDASIVATKDGGNPTFDGDFIPENIIKVGSTYYCIGQTWTTSPSEVHLWTSTDLTTWSAYGSNPIYELGDIPWLLGTANTIYAPEFVEDGGTYYLFYSVCNSTTGQDGKIGLATATTITGPYTDHGTAVLSEGAASSPTSLRVGEASVINFGGQWVMAFMAEDEDEAFGVSEKVFIATAPIPSGPWTVLNSGNPVIDHGANTLWDDDLIADPFIFVVGTTYWILYSGGGSEGGTGTRKWHLGLASSDDLLTWTKHPSNPIISASSSGWDEMAAWRGSLYAEDGAFTGVYGGLNAALTVAKGGNFTLNVTSSVDSPRADDIPIDDAGAYYTATDVEAALQEIGAILAAADSGEGGHYEVIVDGTAPPVAVTNEAEDDWLYGFVPD